MTTARAPQTRRTLCVLLLVAAPIAAKAQGNPQNPLPVPTAAQAAVGIVPRVAKPTPAPAPLSKLPHQSDAAAAASAAASAAAAAVTAGILVDPPEPVANADDGISMTPAADRVPDRASDARADVASATSASAASDAEDTNDEVDPPVAVGSALRHKPLPAMPPGMNESVIRIPLTGAQINLSLEATLFKPDGPGPFPIVIFNHGKERGDPRQQKRSRPLALAREFVQRGYAVLAPNREGFADSDGNYSEPICGIEELGLQQAADVAAAVHYIKQQPFAQTNRIVIIGASEGGLASIAYGEQPDAGVIGIINFSGGLRQDACDSWQQAMVDAFHGYGERSQIPTLWFYGDNDRFWPSGLAPQLYSAYRSGGGRAMLIDFGSYKDNAHRLVGDRDSVPVWWPGVARFLHRLGMPTKVRFAVTRPVLPPATGYAPLQAVNAVPYLDAEGRAGYQNFLEKYPTRAFALSDSGAWSWAEGGDDPITVALDSCQRNSRDACRLYAIDNTVVWPTR